MVLANAMHKKRKKTTMGVEISIWARTNLDTCIAFSASACCTAREIRELIKQHHFSCFPNCGEVNIKSLMAKKKGNLYHIVDSMSMEDVFENTKGIGFLVVEAFKSTSDAHQAASSPDPSNDVMSSMTEHEEHLLDEEPHLEKEFGEVLEYVSLHAKRDINANGVSKEITEKPFPISEVCPGSHQSSASKIHTAPYLSPTSSPNRLEQSQDKELAKAKSNLRDANHKLEKNGRQLARVKQNSKGHNDIKSKTEHVDVSSDGQHITTPTERENELMEVDKERHLVMENGVKINGTSQTCERGTIYEMRQISAESGKTLSETNELKWEYVSRGQLLMKKADTSGSNLKETCETDEMMEDGGERYQFVMGNGVASAEGLNETGEQQTRNEAEQINSPTPKEISDINARRVGDISRCQFVMKRGAASGGDLDLEETHETNRAVKHNMVRDQLDMEKGITSDDDLTEANDSKTRHEVKLAGTDKVKAISEVRGLKQNDTHKDLQELSEMQTVHEMERVSAAALARVLEDEMLDITNKLARKREPGKHSPAEYWSKTLAHRLVQAKKEHSKKNKKKECSKKNKKDECKIQSRKSSEMLEAATQRPETSSASVNCMHCGRQYTKRTSAYYRHLQLCK